MSGRKRGGAVEATLMLFLGMLLAVVVLGTITRRMDASRHGVRLELHAQLSTALESALDEAWWQLCRAVPVRTGQAARASRAAGTEKPSLSSRVLGAVCERTGSPGNPSDVVPTPLVRRAPAVVDTNADLTLEDATLSIATLSPDRMSGLIALRIEGRARRGGTEVRLAAEHRRSFEVILSTIAGAGPRATLGTVHIQSRIVSAEVIER